MKALAARGPNIESIYLNGCAEITDEHQKIAVDDQGGNLGRHGLGPGDIGGGAGDHPSRLPTVLRMAVSTATTAFRKDGWSST